MHKFFFISRYNLWIKFRFYFWYIPINVSIVWQCFNDSGVCLLVVGCAFWNPLFQQVHTHNKRTAGGINAAPSSDNRCEQWSISCIESRNHTKICIYGCIVNNLVTLFSCCERQLLYSFSFSIRTFGRLLSEFPWHSKYFTSFAWFGVFYLRKHFQHKCQKIFLTIFDAR